MHYYRFFQLMFLMLALYLLSGGCVGTTESSRFYTLSPLDLSGADISTKTFDNEMALGIGPINIPEHLDRHEIVTRTSLNRLEIAEFDRWGGSLKGDFANVLAENLSILLSTDHLFFYPWRVSAPIDYQIMVDVTRFEGVLGESVSLSTRWTLISGERDKNVLLMKSSNINEQTIGKSYEDMVAAQSRTLEKLSQEIAEAIKNISK
ncbi:MAG: membrane integrity-associated transporter subunit PqiC [Deltaproteobacteria bacterium]|nr:membrane integrity-associated transporter subunit PqiC [Deltaproteobacteria bacterium]